MSNEKLREAFELGWKMAAQWSLSDHLLADMESPAYLTERDGLLQALATTEPEPTGMPELQEPDEMGDRWLSSHVYTADQMLTYGEQCWKAGYKHGAWGGDAKDAERYRWLADSNNYYEAIDLISDGSLTEDALGKVIDAAMAKGVK